MTDVEAPKIIDPSVTNGAKRPEERLAEFARPKDVPHPDVLIGEHKHLAEVRFMEEAGALRSEQAANGNGSANTEADTIPGRPARAETAAEILSRRRLVRDKRFAELQTRARARRPKKPPEPKESNGTGQGK